MKQLDILSEAFTQFKEESKDYNVVVAREANKLGSLSEAMTKLSEDYTQIVEMIATCKKLLKMSEGLTIQEQSLSLSLKQLELEESLGSEEVKIKEEVTPASS